MKIPSLFRTPKYQRFEIKPRYYDPIKEEMEQRESAIRQELNANGDNADEMSQRSSRISGGFRRATSGGNSASATFTQLIIMVMLAFLIFGYIYLGNTALYVFALMATLLVYLKMRRIL